LNKHFNHLIKIILLPLEFLVGWWAGLGAVGQN